MCVCVCEYWMHKEEKMLTLKEKKLLIEQVESNQYTKSNITWKYSTYYHNNIYNT